MKAIRMRRRASGFTLIEIMIAVAVVAILLAVALPTYQLQVRKAKRQQAKVALMKIAQLQERYYSAYSTYLPSGTFQQLIGLAPGAVVYSGENPADATSAYTISLSVPGGCTITSCYLLTATPNAPFVDPQCGSYTLSSTGVRGVLNATDTVQQCW